MWKILVVLLCLAALILLVVMICDSNRFVKVSYRISDRRLKKNCRVVLLADLHNKSYGKHNEKLLAAIKSSNPDLILCAGDLITSRSGKSMEHAKELVRAISAEYPFYYANGNHEYRIYREPQTYGKMGASYRAFLKETMCGFLKTAAFCCRSMESALPVLTCRENIIEAGSHKTGIENNFPDGRTC